MEVKYSVKEISALFEGMVNCIDYIYKSFNSDDVSVIEKAECVMEDMHERVVALTGAMVKAGKEEPGVRKYVSVPAHIDRIRDNTVRVASCVQRKVEGNIIFSDKAASEVEYLFERLRDIAVHLRQLLDAPSPLVARHIEGSEQAIERDASDFATRHEERLIEGLCMPMASSIYLEMLDAFKNIAWHAGEIAKDLAG